jgi:drug/metabolite transporter (DMT)-like permease
MHGTEGKGPRRWRLALALGTVYLAWGATYPAIRVMVETVPPLLGTAARFAAAGLLMGTILLVRGGPRRFMLSHKQLLGASAVGAVILGDIGLLALAEQEVPAGLAALIIASVPLWIVVLRLLDHQRPERTTLAAVAVGFAGVALLASPTGGTDSPPVGWLLLLVAAAAIEAVGQFWSQRTELPSDLLVSATVQLLAAALALAVAGIALGEMSEVVSQRVSRDSLLAFAYLVVPGSIVAYVAFVWLLANAPISTVSTYAYVNPLVAVFLGWALLSEKVTLAIAAGAAAVLLSVALILRRQPSPPPTNRQKNSKHSRLAP